MRRIDPKYPKTFQNWEKNTSFPIALMNPDKKIGKNHYNSDFAKR